MDDEPTTAERTDAVRFAIESSGLEPGPSHRCHYLKDRFARDLAFSASTLPSGVYRSLMELVHNLTKCLFDQWIPDRKTLLILYREVSDQRRTELVGGEALLMNSAFSTKMPGKHMSLHLLPDTKNGTR